MDAASAERQDHPIVSSSATDRRTPADPPGVETKEELYNL